MSYKKILLYETLIQSYRNLFKKKLLFLYAFLTEIAFLIFSGIDVNYYGFKILDVLVQLTKIMQDNFGIAAQAYLNEQSIISAMSQQKIFMGLYNDLIGLTAKMLAIIILAWIAFKGANWFISSRISGRKTGYFKYIVNFAAITLFFSILISFMFIITGKMVFKALENLPLGGNNFLNYATLFFNFVLFYFMLTSYGLIGKLPLKKIIWKNFVIGVKKIHYLLPMFALIVAKLTIAIYILSLLFKINFALVLLFSLILVIPILIWAKVFIITTLGQVLGK